MIPKTGILLSSILLIFLQSAHTLKVLPKNISLAFVIDTTGSMAIELEEVKSMTISIVDKIANNSKIPITKFIFVPFNDPGVGPLMTTSDPEQLKAQLKTLTATGGGATSCVEYCLTGIMMGLNESLPYSEMYVFTDAPPLDMWLEDSVYDKIQEKRTEVNIILTDGCHTPSEIKIYEGIAEISNGVLFESSKSSMSQIMDFIDWKIMLENKVSLGSRTNPPGYNNTLSIFVDMTISLVSVSVSGTASQIIVTNPSGVIIFQSSVTRGKIISDPTKVNVTLDLNKIKVVNLIEPEPGTWSLTYGSSTKHSVKVIAVSGIRFEFGFYPQKLADVSDEVVQGELTHMVVKVFDEDTMISKLVKVKILNTTGSVLDEIPLEPLRQSSLDDMYTTKTQFLVPDVLFSITVVGMDIEGNTFERLSTTSILGKVPNPDESFLLFAEKPKINRPKNSTITFEFGNTAALYCEVTGIPEPKISWKLPNDDIVDTECEVYVIDQIERKDAGNYICIATNAAGTDEFITTVVVRNKTIIDPGTSENKSNILSSSITTNFIILTFAYQILMRLSNV